MPRPAAQWLERLGRKAVEMSVDKAVSIDQALDQAMTSIDLGALRTVTEGFPCPFFGQGQRAWIRTQVGRRRVV